MEFEGRGVKEEEKVDAIEQYGRRQNLEITGIKVRDGEDTNKIVVEVAKLMNVETLCGSISTSHRLPTKPKRNNNDQADAPPPAPPSIIVCFISRDVRNKIYENRKLLRNADLFKFSVDDTKAIFINENLTHNRKKIILES